MDFLAGRVALVTGGASGMGRAMALALAEAGALERAKAGPVSSAKVASRLFVRIFIPNPSCRASARIAARVPGSRSLANRCVEGSDSSAW